MRNILQEAIEKMQAAQHATVSCGSVAGTKRLDLYKFICKDKSINANYKNILTGVYHDPEGWAVATDTRILVASRAAYRAEYSGKVIDKDGNEVTTRQYPKWKSCIPATEASEVPLNGDEILSMHKQMTKRIKQDGLTPNDCFKVYKVGNFWFNLDFLKKVVDIAPTLKPIEKMAARYKSDDLIVLVMPMLDQLKNTDLDPNTYAILKCNGDVIESFSRTASASATAEPKRKLNNPLAI